MSWILRTPWLSALTSSSMTCACFDHSIKMSVSTVHKQSEWFSLDCTCKRLCESSLAVIDYASIQSLLMNSLHRFFEENHSGLPLLTDKDEPKTDTDTHQCKRVCFTCFSAITQESHLSFHDSWRCSCFCSLTSTPLLLQVHSPTGSTADCSQFHFTLSTVLCAKSTSLPILTLQLSQL